MKINEQNVSNNLHRFNDIYPEDKPQNNVPENTKVIVYCSNGNDVEGWAAVEEVSDLGFEQLIAKSWITQEEFLSW